MEWHPCDSLQDCNWRWQNVASLSEKFTQLKHTYPWIFLRSTAKAKTNVWNEWLGRRSTSRFKRLANNFKSRQWPPTRCLLWMAYWFFCLDNTFFLWTPKDLPYSSFPWSISYLQRFPPHMLFLYCKISQKWEVFVFQSPALSQRVRARVGISGNTKKQLIHSLGPTVCSILDHLENSWIRWHSDLLWNIWWGIMVLNVLRWKPWSWT